jgi:hypothetical protein
MDQAFQVGPGYARLALGFDGNGALSENEIHLYAARESPKGKIVMHPAIA